MHGASYKHTQLEKIRTLPSAHIGLRSTNEQRGVAVAHVYAPSSEIQHSASIVASLCAIRVRLPGTRFPLTFLSGVTAPPA